mgnify:CR=1 FL=1
MRPARWWWFGLLAFAFATFAAGVLLERKVARQLESTLASELTTIRDLNVTALREWLGAVERAGVATASDPEVRGKALELFRDSERVRTADELAALPAQAELRRRLEPMLRVWKLDDYVLIAHGRTVGATRTALLALPVPASDLPPRALRGEPAIDLPHKPTVDAFDARESLMWVINPIKGDAGAVQGFIAFKIDTEHTFTRLLKTARFGDSGETYAFARDGMLLSTSRFEDHLRSAGVLKGSQRSALNLSAREPAESLSVGGALGLAGPLTRAAREASEGRTGADVSGYRDYRGAEVVGAWTWLDDYGFAVATELDREEAYRSSRVVRNASRALTAIIFACAIVIGAGSSVMRRMAMRSRRIERLGQYTIEKKLGEGGMGVVYRAHHALLRRPTAVKVLKGVAADAEVLGRFEREVQTMASLTHPNTVAVFDYGRTRAGVPYYVMEFLSGRSLEDLVEEVGALPQARVVYILLQVLGSLEEAHDSGIVHRDIKPANVMLCRRGGLADFVKVVDFGLVKRVEGAPDAKLTQTNTILGTPLYMSPEAIQDPESIDARSDLYAVGAVAYFLLSGRPIVDGPTVMAILSKQMVELPTPLTEIVPGIAPELGALVTEVLAKSRDDRPGSAREIAARLEAIRDAHGLQWTQSEAAAWWDAHPIGTKGAEHDDAGTAPTELSIELAGRGLESGSA